MPDFFNFFYFSQFQHRYRRKSYAKAAQNMNIPLYLLDKHSQK